MKTYTRRLRPGLSPSEHTAFLQLAWTHDVLTSFLTYLTDPWQRSVVKGAIQGVAPDNPKLKEYFRT